MPRTRSLAWAELKIGVLAITAVIVASVVIFSVGGQGGFFWQRYTLRTQFPDVQGLKTGAVVRVAGVEVGAVTDVRFEGSRVEVVMQVSRDMQPRVTTRSQARIGSLSLLGEPVIDITAADDGEPLQDGASIPSTEAGQLMDVAQTANRTLEEATGLIQGIRRGEGSMGKLFTEDAFYDELVGFIDSVNEVTSGLSRGDGTLGALLKDPAAYKSLQASMDNLDGIVSRINAGEGSLGRLVTDDAFATSLTSATEHFSAVGSKLNSGEGTAGKLMTDPELFDRLNSVTGRLDTLTENLNQGEGTAGQLLRDRQLYENMNGAVDELKQLIADIRADPKKYLNVKVSIF